MMLTNEIAKRCACYIRVSTAEQTEFSPDSQLKLIRQYALNNNIEVLEEHIYKDEGISGTKAEKRPSFLRMIQNTKAKQKPFDCILVYDFSRFARNREESIVFKSMLKKKKIQIISITQPLSDDKSSVILEAMLEAMDEYYSLNLSENVRRGQAEKASRGEFRGNPPYGYVYHKHTKMLEIDSEKAEIVHMIFNDYIDGNNPLNVIRITKKLNSMNIKTNNNNKWSKESVKSILHNPIYISKIRYSNGGFNNNPYSDKIIIYDGKHEPIIPLELWEKAQKLNDRKHNDLTKRLKPTVRNEHWLRGIIKCSNCGKILVKNQKHFQCCGYNKGQCDKSHYVRVHNIVDSILQELKNTFTLKLEIKHQNDNTKYDYDITLILNQIKRNNEKEERLKNAYEDGIYELSEFKDRLNISKKEKDNLNKELEQLKKDKKISSTNEFVYKKCEEYYKLLVDDNVDNNKKFIIAHELFDKIIWDRPNNKIKIYYK